MTDTIGAMSFENPTREERIGFWLEWMLSGPLIRPYLVRLGLRGDETLLEIGFGGGAVTRQLARVLRNGRVVGVDPSAYWIEVGKRRLRKAKHVSLFAGDVLSVDLAPATFDAVLFHYVLHDIPTAERPSTFDRIYELLKDGGRLYLREPTKASHGMPAAEIRRLAESVGLREVSGEERTARILGPQFFGVFEKV